MRSGTRPWWLVPLAVYAVVLAVFAVSSPLNLTAFPIDDAWIHRVYARAFAYAEGFAYNAGEQTTGFTSPLWVIVTSPVHWFEFLGTIAVVVGVKLAGVVLGGLTIMAAYRIAAHGAQSTWPAVVAASVVACQPVLAFSALGGMETLLLLALWTWSIVFVQAERLRSAAVLIGLMPVARPEGVVLAGVTVIALVITQRHAVRDTLRGRAAITTLAALAVPTLAWIAYCFIVSGHPLPATYYLKASGAITGEAASHLVTLLTEHGVSRSWPLVAAGCVALGWCVRTRPAIALLGIGSLVFVVSILVTRTFSLSGYYWTRWTDPGVLGFTIAWLIALARALDALMRSSLSVELRRGALAAVGLVAAIALPGLVASIEERAARFASDASVIERMNVAPGRWIAEHVPADDIVGVNDAGALRYFGGRRTIDVVGLNSLDVAFRRVPMEAVAKQLDWLAAYPAVGSALAAAARFKTVASFTVPPAEYTICACPGQTLMTVSQRADALLTAEQRDMLVAALRGAGPHTAALAASARDADALADAAELRAVFEAAGWQVPPIASVEFRLRPGLGLLAADAPASAPAEAVRAAFERAGVPVVFAPGYRAHLERNPRSLQIPLAPGQDFVIAVGRRAP